MFLFVLSDGSVEDESSSTFTQVPVLDTQVFFYLLTDTDDLTSADGINTGDRCILLI